MQSTIVTPEKRRRVARTYGYPWPWQIRELVEEHAVDRDVDLREMADEWGCSEKKLSMWIRKHGFRTENGRAKR